MLVSHRAIALFLGLVLLVEGSSAFVGSRVYTQRTKVLQQVNGEGRVASSAPLRAKRGDVVDFVQKNDKTRTELFDPLALDAKTSR